MVSPKKDGSSRPSFLSSPSTYWVTLIRLFLILLPELLNGYDWNNGNRSPFILLSWLQSPALLSVLVRPHETLSHLKEAQAIRALSVGKSVRDIYIANNSIRIPPLIYATWSQLTHFSLLSSELSFGLFLLLVDLGIGYMLEQIGHQLLFSLNNRQNDEEERLQRILPEVIRPPYAHIFPIYRPKETQPNPESKREQSPIIPMTRLPLLAAQLYYWSPFTAFPSGLNHCWQSVKAFVLVASIYESSRTNGSISVYSFYLAVAAYMEPHYTIYIIPCSVLYCRNDDRGSFFKVTVALSVAMFALWSIGLHGLSYTLVVMAGSDTNSKFYWNSVLGSIYGNAWFASPPNMSMQWYFHMQLFKRFRSYFGAIFTGIPFVLVGPLVIRFGNYPEVLIAAFSMIWTIYRPIQVLYDANLALCFFLFSPRSLARMEVPSFVSLCCLLVPVVLNVTDYWMWLGANNGNANYMFFQCLAYNVFLGVILGQFTSASMQRDKALRITSKEEKERGVVVENAKEKSE